MKHKTLGQVCFEAFMSKLSSNPIKYAQDNWEILDPFLKDKWEFAAKETVMQAIDILGDFE